MNPYLRTPIMDIAPPLKCAKQSGRGQLPHKGANGPANPPPQAENQPYHPHVRSDVTKWMERPASPHSINEIPPHAFNRKKTSITEPMDSNILGTKGQSKGESRVPWYGRSSTDVSEYLHKAPPPQLEQDKSLPRYEKTLGRAERWNLPSRQNANPLSAPTSNHWWRDEPAGAPLAIPPQYMRREDLYAALPQQRETLTRSEFQDGTVVENRRPTSVDAPMDVHTPGTGMGTLRSDLDDGRDLKTVDLKRPESRREPRQSRSALDAGGDLKTADLQRPDYRREPRNPREQRRTQTEEKEAPRPRFSAGGVVRPFPPPELRRPSRSSSLPPSRAPSIARSSIQSTIIAPGVARSSIRNGVSNRSSLQGTPAASKARTVRGPRRPPFVQHHQPWRG